MAMGTKNITLDDIVISENYLFRIKSTISKHASKIHKVNSLAYLSLVSLPFTQTLTGSFFIPDYAVHMAAFAGANTLKFYEFKTNLGRVRRTIARELLFNHQHYSKDINNGVAEAKTSF